MKTKILIAVLVCTIPVLGCSAQKTKKKDKKGAATEQVEAKVEQKQEQKALVTAAPSDECRENYSLAHENIKKSLFDEDTENQWRAAYNECPNITYTLYSDGVKLLDWKYSQATTDAEKNAIREEIMNLYDERVRYFGTNPKFPTPYILGLKAMDYVKYYPEDKVKEPAYQWLDAYIDGMKGNANPSMVQTYIDLALSVYKTDPTAKQDKFLADYQKAQNTLDAIIATQPTMAAAAQSRKVYVDQVFASSGAADCDKLDEVFAQQVKDNLDNAEMLGGIMKIFKRAKCIESEVYFAAAEASHKLQPTAESAAGCASMSKKKGDFKTAVSYYEQAIEMAEDTEDKIDYLHKIALIYNNQGQYQQVRNYARKALALDPNDGTAYLLIGIAYAASPNIYGNDEKGRVLNKTVYWLAVDYFQKAKNVDSSLADDANKQIAKYRNYFPDKADAFMLGIHEGDTFKVEGWIQETTKVRF